MQNHRHGSWLCHWLAHYNHNVHRVLPATDQEPSPLHYIMSDWRYFPADDKDQPSSLTALLIANLEPTVSSTLLVQTSSNGQPHDHGKPARQSSQQRLQRSLHNEGHP